MTFQAAPPDSLPFYNNQKMTREYHAGAPLPSPATTPMQAAPKYLTANATNQNLAQLIVSFTPGRSAGRWQAAPLPQNVFAASSGYPIG